MIKALLVDDEPLAISVIRDYLKDHPEIQIAGECLNGFEAFKMIQQEKPDLLFLDIQMPKINGFELLEMLDPAPPVIFITAFNEHAVQAFEKHAVDYLLKPVSKERFESALSRFKSSHKDQDQKIKQIASEIKEPHQDQSRIVVKNGSNIRILSTDEVYYIEAYDDYLKIFTEKDCFLKKQTLQSMEDQLDRNEFLRVHRSYILKLSTINKIEPFGKDTHIALLKNGAKVPLSRTGYPRLKEVLGI
jgi:two-component system, LytTR family, response regulator